MKRPTCRHCRRKPANRPRGLCWTCFHSPARDLYATTSVFARRGVGDVNAPSRPPAAPCPHLPRSEGRLRTLAERAARGEAMTHPGDNAGDLT